MADFILAEAEFTRQAAILSTLSVMVDVNAARTAPVLVDGRALPFVPNGGQNTMAAAAVVLLAAHFEEYVRQQVEEYGRSLVGRYRNLDDDSRIKFIDAYWRSGLNRLQRIRPKYSIQWSGHALPLLRGLATFPAEDDEGAFVAAWLCDHDNNMRFDTVLDLCGRVGVKRLAERMARSNALKGALGITRQADASEALRGKLGEFYDLRNTMVHSIAQYAGIGPTIFESWKNFLLIFSSAFKDAMENALEEFEASISPIAAPQADAAAQAI